MVLWFRDIVWQEECAINRVINRGSTYSPGHRQTSMQVWFHYSHLILRPQHIRTFFSVEVGVDVLTPYKRSFSQWTTVHRITIWSAFLREQSLLWSITSLYQQLFPARLVASRSPLLPAQLGLSRLCRSQAANLDSCKVHRPFTRQSFVMYLFLTLLGPLWPWFQALMKIWHGNFTLGILRGKAQW